MSVMGRDDGKSVMISRKNNAVTHRKNCECLVTKYYTGSSGSVMNKTDNVSHQCNKAHTPHGDEGRTHEGF